MLGYLRFILAIFVLLSHLNIKLYGFFDIGWFAVFIFYILAGMVTTKVFVEVANKEYSYFFKDRFLRIYPLFFTWLTIALLFFIITGYADFEFSLIKTILHYLLIPLNYAPIFNDLGMIMPKGDAQIRTIVTPQYFSLALEMQAYILLAIVLTLKSLSVGRILAIASLVVYTGGVFGIFDWKDNPGLFNYILLIGVFFCFYIGILIHQKRHKEIAFFYIFFFILLMCVFFIVKESFGAAIETLVALLIGIPIIVCHEIKRIRAKGNALLGSLSYGVFLNHYLLIYVYVYLFNSVGEYAMYVIIISSIIFSLVTYLCVEKQINKIRFKKVE